MIKAVKEATDSLSLGKGDGTSGGSGSTDECSAEDKPNSTEDLEARKPEPRGHPTTHESVTDYGKKETGGKDEQNQDPEPVTYSNAIDHGKKGEEKDGEPELPEHSPEGDEKNPLLSIQEKIRFLEADKLPETTASYLMMAKKRCSIPFLTGMLVWFLKFAIFGLVALNLLDRTGSLDIPVLVSAPVVFSQAIAFTISVWTQEDLTTSIIMMCYGRDPQFNICQWVLSVALIFVNGMVGIAVTFMLIITSSTVLDVLLNFAAVEFVSGLDNVAFSLAKEGFFGSANKDAAKDVTNTKREYAKNKKCSHPQFVTLVMWFVVLASWVFVFVHQKQGHYATKTLYIQFDDEARPDLAPHSGFYQLDNSREYFSLRSGFTYLEEGRGGGKIAYCASRSRWTFTKGVGDPCEDTLLESAETSSFDVLDAATGAWQVQLPMYDAATTDLRTHMMQVQLLELSNSIPMDLLYLSAGCDTSDDCGGKSRGECHDNRCVCIEGWEGLTCSQEVEASCKSLGLNELYQTRFPTQRAIATKFDRIKGAVYNRPVFFNNHTKDVIFFSGLRWAISNIDLMFGDAMPNRTFGSALQGLLSNSFHASSVTYVDLLSSAVRSQSPSDRFNSPVDLSWFSITSMSKRLDSVELTEINNPIRLVCSTCHEAKNPCLSEGVCRSGVCECRNEATGALCQVPPTGDGKCDEFFNRGDYNYDGGDCCLSTCVNTFKTMCGVVNRNGTQSIDTGFPTCRDPRVLGECGDDEPCFISNGFFRPVPGSITRPYLSSNGRTLALADDAFASVRVVERVGSEWRQRGQTLLSIHSNLGRVLDLHTPPANLVQQSSMEMPIFLAMSETQGPSEHMIRIFHYGRTDSSWTETTALDYQNVVDLPRDNLYGDDRVGAITIRTPGFELDRVVCLFSTFVFRRSNLLKQVKEGTVDYHLVYRTLSGTEWNVGLSRKASLAALSGNGRRLALYDHSNGRISFHSELSSTKWNSRPRNYTINEFIKESPNDHIVPRDMKLSHDGLRATFVMWHSELLNGVTHEFHKLYLFYRTNKEMSLLQESREIYTNFTLGDEGVHFSTSGSALAIYGFEKDDSPAERRSFKSHIHILNRTQVFEKIGVFEGHQDYSEFLQGNHPRLSLSDDALTMSAWSPSERGTVVSNLINRCDSDHVLFRLSLTLLPSNSLINMKIFWKITDAHLSPFNNQTVTGKTLASCENPCYIGRSDHEYVFGATILEEFCLPKIPLQFSFSMTSSDDDYSHPRGAGYAAYLVDGKSSTVVAAKSGFDQSNDPPDTYFLFDSDGLPQVEKLNCEENESLVTVLVGIPFEFDSLMLSIETEGKGRPLFSSYNKDQAGDTVIEQVCLETAACHEVDLESFPTSDAVADLFIVYYGNEEIFRFGHSVENGDQSVRHSFGELCEEN